MAAANRLWGVPRIHGELLKLGFHLDERTVSRLIPKRHTPPSQTHVPYQSCPGSGLPRFLHHSHRPRVLIMALPAFVWVEIESSAMKVDGDLEVLRVAEAAGGLLHPLDHGVDCFEARIGKAVLQVGQQVG